MVGQLPVLDPEGVNNSVRLRNVAVRLVCAGGLQGRGDDPMVRNFKERLLLVSGNEWDPVAAGLLLKAAQQMFVRLGGQSCAAAEHFIDSLRQLATTAITAPGTASQWPQFTCDTIDITQHQGKVWLTAAVFGLSPGLADLLVDFFATPSPQDTSTDIAALKDMVSGLVSSPASIKEQPHHGKPVDRRASVGQQSVEKPDNSAAALRYRTQQSIRDSINKHIPNLKQLYKKSLKINPSIAGKVVMTIRVGAGGRVISANIKTSEISNKTFLVPLAVYVRTIRFKPIPEKIGNMTFDFPFEFNPEM